MIKLCSTNFFDHYLYFGQVYWDNDLSKDVDRQLRINSESRFFSGFKELALEEKIFAYLERYASFDFKIDYEQWIITFSRQNEQNIKVSRGEQNIFIWCIFLAICELAIDDHESYAWVKYLYIDDPISSLDDNNAIAVASNLARLLKNKDSHICAVISSHHALFFNVLHNELDARKSKKVGSYFLSQSKSIGSYTLRYTNATPFFQHVAMLTELHEAQKSGKLYTYHFSMLRNLLEKSASFHGFSNFSACLKQDDDDPDGVLYARLINILSHGNYSLYGVRPQLDTTIK